MPTRLDPGVNAHPIPAGIVLSTDEWHRLTDPLGMAGHTLEETFLVLAGRIDASYNVAHTVRELIDAGEPGSSVPPKDLPAAIRRIGEARHAAEHHAKQLAGEVADLRDRLEDRLPAVFTTVLEELADTAVLGICGEVTDESCQLVVDAGIKAYRLALRLLEDYDVRDRDQARPTEGHYTRQPVTFTAMPQVDVNDATFLDERDPDATVTMWGHQLTVTHPAVTWIADHFPYRLTGCDNSTGCKRAVVLRALKDTYRHTMTKMGPSTDPDASPWNRTDVLVNGTADNLAATLEPPGDYSLAVAAGTIRRVIQDGIEHARIILLDVPCRICDGSGFRHRLGCPNG